GRPLTPYDQPLLSRRSMLRRDRKLPPSASFAADSGITSPRGSTGISCPPRMLDCGAPGRLTSRIFCAAGRGGGAAKFLTPFGAVGAAQLPKRASSSGLTSLSGKL